MLNTAGFEKLAPQRTQQLLYGFEREPDGDLGSGSAQGPIPSTFTLPRGGSMARYEPSGRGGEACEKDGFMIAKLGYKQVRETTHLAKSCSRLV